MGCALATRSSQNFAKYIPLGVGSKSTTDCHPIYVLNDTKFIEAVKEIFIGSIELLPLSIGTISKNKYININSDISVYRDEKYNELIGKIYSFLYLQENWDGYGGISPSNGTVNTIVAFVTNIKNNRNISPPKVMLNGDGEISLLWKKDDLYIEVGFDDENQYSFLINAGTLIIGKDDCNFSDKKIDADLLFYLNK